MTFPLMCCCSEAVSIYIISVIGQCPILASLSNFSQLSTHGLVNKALQFNLDNVDILVTCKRTIM
jgi:hypothetical protein